MLEATEVIDSRDVIARIEELESELEDLGDVSEYEEPDDLERVELQDELDALQVLADEASASPDWPYGETLIRDDYFVEHTKELVNDCYERTDVVSSSEWPWRHLEMDWDGAAEELKQDYFSVEYLDQTYWIRA